MAKTKTIKQESILDERINALIMEQITPIKKQLEEKDQKIAELEKKLAERERQLEEERTKKTTIVLSKDVIIAAIKKAYSKKNIQVLYLEVIQSKENPNNWYYLARIKGKGINSKGEEYEYNGTEFTLKRYAGNRIMQVVNIAPIDIPIIIELLKQAKI